MIVLFDLDRTLYPGSTLVPLGRSLRAHGHLTTSTLLAGICRAAAFARSGETSGMADRVRERALAVVAGRTEEQLRPCLDEAADEVVAGLRPGAPQLVRDHLAAGHYSVILTAAPQELAAAVATRLGLHRAVGTVAERTDDGVFTGGLVGPFCHGEGKVVRLRESIGDVPLGEATFYSDSITDLPVLRRVGRPVAVHPDAALRQVATAEGWEVIELDRVVGRSVR